MSGPGVLSGEAGAMMPIGTAGSDDGRIRGRRIFAVSGAAVAVALVVGGVIGGLIGAGSRDVSSTAPVPVTVTAAAPSIDVNVPASPDPVCAEWIPLADSYRTKRAAWVAIDPSISADRLDSRPAGGEHCRDSDAAFGS